MIHHKTVLDAFKALHDLSDLLQPHLDSQVGCIYISHSALSTSVHHGPQSLQSFYPCFGKSIPFTIRNTDCLAISESRLKTHLFKQAYLLSLYLLCRMFLDFKCVLAFCVSFSFAFDCSFILCKVIWRILKSAFK